MKIWLINFNTIIKNKINKLKMMYCKQKTIYKIWILFEKKKTLLINNQTLADNTNKYKCSFVHLIKFQTFKKYHTKTFLNKKCIEEFI